jgi:hypothetical protein
MFASLNSCKGFNKSRRDDIESVLYIIIYLLNKKYLPWLNIRVSPFEGLKEILADRIKEKNIRALYDIVDGK